MTDIVILSGARTAIGTFGGSLSGFAPIDLATHASKAAIDRAGIAPDQIGHVVFGHVINTEPRDMYLSRVAAINAGIPDTTPAMNVNRLCGSGAQAIVSATQALMLGDADFALAGGAECMSRSPHILSASRWGQKMAEFQSPDLNWDGNINGNPAPEGAYVYLVTWIGCDHERRTAYGTFHLLR